MTSGLRPWCEAAHWLALTLWTAALLAAGIAAMIVFSRMDELALTLNDFAGYPADRHGRIAAGMVMADVFFVVDLIQFTAAPVALVTLAAQLLGLGRPRRRIASVIRTAGLVAAAGLLAFHAIGLAPAMNADLRASWDAARSGELDRAAALQIDFGRRHRAADAVLKTNLLLLLIVIAASAVAATPRPSVAAGPALEPPRLLRTR